MIIIYRSIYPVAVYHFYLTISINLYLRENFIRKLNFKKQEICFKPSWGQILDQQNKKKRFSLNIAIKIITHFLFELKPLLLKALRDAVKQQIIGKMPKDMNKDTNFVYIVT